MKLTFVHTIKAAIACTLMLAVVAWVEYSYGWATTLASWSEVNWAVLISAVLLVCISHVLRACRIFFAYRSKNNIRFKPTLGVSLIHNTVSYLLPMRLGEIALPALSKHQLKVDLKYSTATLFLIRIFDAHVLLMLLSFFAGSLWLGKNAYWLPVGLLLALPITMQLLKALSQKVEKLKFAVPLYAQTYTWATLYCLTISIWVVKLYALALLSSLLGNIDIGHAWIASILADGSALSPVTGIANAGTFELAFVLPLTPLGYNTQQLVQAAVNLHIFILVINLCAGSFGTLLLDKRASND